MSTPLTDLKPGLIWKHFLGITQQPRPSKKEEKVIAYLQELVGYNTFFLLVMVFCLPGTLLVPFLKLDSSFGGNNQTADRQETT